MSFYLTAYKIFQKCGFIEIFPSIIADFAILQNMLAFIENTSKY